MAGGAARLPGAGAHRTRRLGRARGGDRRRRRRLPDQAICHGGTASPCASPVAPRGRSCLRCLAHRQGRPRYAADAHPGGRRAAGLVAVGVPGAQLPDAPCRSRGAANRTDGAFVCSRPRPGFECGRSVDLAAAAQTRRRPDRDSAGLWLFHLRLCMTMKKGSLRLRLFAAGAVSIVLALTIAAAGLMLLFERHVERRVVLELETDLRQLVSGLTRNATGALEVSRLPAEPRFLEPLSGMYWQIVQQPAGPVLRSRSLWDSLLALPSDTLGDGDVHRHRLRGPDGTPVLTVERSVTLPDNLGGGHV